MLEILCVVDRSYIYRLRWWDACPGNRSPTNIRVDAAQWSFWVHSAEAIGTQKCWAQHRSAVCRQIKSVHQSQEKTRGGDWLVQTFLILPNSFIRDDSILLAHPISKTRSSHGLQNCPEAFFLHSDFVSKVFSRPHWWFNNKASCFGKKFNSTKSNTEQIVDISPDNCCEFWNHNLWRAGGWVSCCLAYLEKKRFGQRKGYPLEKSCGA